MGYIAWIIVGILAVVVIASVATGSHRLRNR
jgi:hypothetical protein